MSPRSTEIFGNGAFEQPNRTFDRRRTQVHVALRGGDVRVTGQLLNRPRRRPAHREMRTERVPKAVRPAALEPRAPRRSYDRPRHRAFRVGIAIVPVEHPWPTEVSRVAERRCETRRHRHIAEPPAFGRIDMALPHVALDADQPLGQIKVGPLQRDRRSQAV
jgi:hypothetical protein